MDTYGVDWSSEIRLSWGEEPNSMEDNADIELTALVRNFNLPFRAVHNASMIIDDPRTTNSPGIRCVIMGMENAHVSRAEKKHYVLLVVPVQGKHGIYERVGVGYMPGSCIDMETVAVAVAAEIR
jgi:hypothetical protein